MHIGIVAPPFVPVPPLGYGGTEQVIDDLARSLAQLGHDVQLFTVGTSTTPVHRSWLYPGAATPMGHAGEEAAHVLAAYEQFADVDVVHDHTVLGPLLAAADGSSRPPIVSTQHGAFDLTNRRVAAAVARHADVVAISRSHARSAAGVPIAAVVPHGIDLERYHPGGVADDYLVFLARMSPDKGPDRAIRIARSVGRRLVIATKMREPAERQYFHDAVEPLLRRDVQVLVEPPFATKVSLLQRAAALVNPIDWPEPFGLAMVEALACGTPVLGCPHGAAREIVDDGVTGFLRSDEAGLVAAAARLGELDRADCRAAAQRFFARERMAADYVRLYEAARVRGIDAVAL